MENFLLNERSTSLRDALPTHSIINTRSIFKKSNTTNKGYSARGFCSKHRVVSRDLVLSAIAKRNFPHYQQPIALTPMSVPQLMKQLSVAHFGQ